MLKKYFVTLCLFLMIQNLTSAQNCPALSTVIPYDIGSDFVTLRWMSNGSETQWEVITLPHGSPAPSVSASGTLTTSNPHTITNLDYCTNYDFYVRAVCSETEKSSWMPRLHVNTSIPLVRPIPDDLKVCDTNNDGFAAFNLAAYSDVILAGLDTSIYHIAYFTSANDSNQNTNPITNLENYTNIIPFQMPIFVRIQDHNGSCYIFTGFKLITVPTPVFSLQDASVCFDPNTNTTAPYTFNTHLSDTEYHFEWFLGANSISGANGSTFSTSTPGIYSVTATNSDTGCQSTATASLSTTVIPTATATANNQTVTVTVNGQGSYQYQMDNGSIQSSHIFENVTPGDHTITIIPLNSGCAPFSITTTVTLHNDNFAFEQFNYYPNPVIRTLTIQAPESFTRITVSNLLGQTIIDKTFTETNLYEIDFSEPTKGIYLVRITRNNQNKTFKVIKE